ncbi:MAG: MATE family efflux transporter, partial [Acidobacteria bacterium]|nr:MATE family efflux transporter [Acidobacteriota bacterium]
AAPAVLQFTIATASWSVLVRVVAGFGEEALAGYGVGLRIIIFALLPAVGLSNAAATLVGQNLGAGNPERAEKSVWKAAWINAAFLGAISLVFLIFANAIVGFFTNEPNVQAIAADALRIVAYGFVFYGFGMVLETAFNGAGDTWTPTFLNFFIFWLFEIPLAYLLSYYFGYGVHGVFWAITLAFSLLAVVSAVLFNRGKWKEKKV